MKTPNYYQQIIQTLRRLNKAHPFYNMGQHLSTAMDGSELWAVSDKELLFSLQKYEITLDMDVDHIDDKEIEAIIKDGMNLEKLFEEEED